MPNNNLKVKGRTGGSKSEAGKGWFTSSRKRSLLRECSRNLQIIIIIIRGWTMYRRRTAEEEEGDCGQLVVVPVSLIKFYPTWLFCRALIHPFRCYTYAIIRFQSSSFGWSDRRKMKLNWEDKRELLANCAGKQRWNERGWIIMISIHLS